MPTNADTPVEFRAGDIVRLRKPHPCGGFEWTVLRIGGDIGLKCRTCNRRLMLPRRELERRLKSFVSRGPEMVDGVLSGAPGPSE
ncbi:MAG TPA: DUF951 domain-containing protein [Thermomicrobiales bacterium]|nr:DUF951 domain-containing protein [Thermomicrobiales bacterium]